MIQVDRRKELDSQDLFPFVDQKWRKILRALFCFTDEKNWINRTFFFGSPKEFIMGPNHWKLFNTKQGANNFEQSK